MGQNYPVNLFIAAQAHSKGRVHVVHVHRPDRKHPGDRHFGRDRMLAADALVAHGTFRKVFDETSQWITSRGMRVIKREAIFELTHEENT